MFDRDTEVASNSAVSFNNEDEAEELALARLEAELRALEVEEESLAREEVEEKAEAEAAEREADQAVASISAELRAHEELMRSCMWVTETWEVYESCKDAVAESCEDAVPLMKSGRYLQPCNMFFVCTVKGENVAYRGLVRVYSSESSTSSSSRTSASCASSWPPPPCRSRPRRRERRRYMYENSIVRPPLPLSTLRPSPRPPQAAPPPPYRSPATPPRAAARARSRRARSACP